MRWEESGEGRAVVLLHGIPTSPALWRRVVPLVPNVRLLAWEMVGYGASWPQAGRDISLHAQAGYLLEWLDALGIEKAVLVGHDLGGGVAQIAAVTQPERCSGLVLTNAVCYDSWPVPSVNFMRSIPAVVARTPPLLFRGVFSSFLRRGHDDQGTASESIGVHWRHYDHADGPAVFTKQIRSLRMRDTKEIAPALPSLDVSTAIVWGVADGFQKFHYGQRLATDLGASLDGISGGKHFVPEDHPDRIAAAIKSVLT